MKELGATLTIIALFFMFGLMIGSQLQPNCPTEDSCQADYQDGHWLIVEVTP